MGKKPEQLIPATTGSGHSAGQVQVDSRGRNVWHWNDAQIDSTSILLKRLENDALELEPTRKVPIQQDPQADAAKQHAARGKQPDRGELTFSDTLNVKVGGGGFDPYNRS